MAGASEGRVLSNFLQIGEGQTCFVLNQGRVTVLLAREKILHVASILYIQAKLPVKINPNYLQVSIKFIYQKTIFSQLTLLSFSTRAGFRPYFDVSARGSGAFTRVIYNSPHCFYHVNCVVVILITGSLN